MKSFWILLLALLPVLVLGQKRGKVKMESYADSLSYALGADLANNLSNLPIELSSDMIFQGMRDGMEGEGDKFTQQQIQQLMAAFQREAQAAQMAKMAERAKVAKEEGKLFLADNQEKEGVITTASGLQYKILRAGTGASPSASSVVKVHYEGRLLNEEIFDSSYQRGQPIEFSVGGVIPGWTEALQLMKEGAKWQIYIPSNLAYGERGSPPKIGPGETLVFDVELLEVK